MNHNINKPRRRIELGQIVATPGAIEAVPSEEMAAALGRHARGDWGELCSEDRAENELAIRDGFRLLSCYRTLSDVRFWIISEADRSATTVLLPEEY